MATTPTSFTKIKLKNGEVKTATSLETADTGSVSIETGKAANYQGYGNTSTADISDITLVAGKYSSLYAGNITAATKIGAIKATANIGAQVNLNATTNNGSVGAITLDAAASAYIYASINANVENATTTAQLAAATVGAVTLTSAGYGANTNLYVNATHAKVGDVKATASGYDSSSSANVFASSADVTIGTVTSVQGGSVGNVTFAATATDSNLSGNITATGSSALHSGGNIGNVAFTASGSSSQVYVSSAIRATDGNIGNVTLSASGEESRIYTGNGFVVTNGNVGTVTANASGAGSQVNSNVSATAILVGTGVDAKAVGGNIGKITLNATAQYARANISASATGVFSAGGTYYSAGNIGDVAVNNSTEESSANISLNALNGGNIGNIVMNNKAFQDDNSNNLNAFAQFGNIKDVTVSNTGVYSRTNVDLRTITALDVANKVVGGNIGNLTFGADGRGSYVYANVNAAQSTTGTVGKVNLTAAGVDANSNAYIYAGGNVGDVTVKASGASSNVYANVESTNGNVGAVSATASASESQAQINVTATKGTVGAVTVVASAESSDSEININQTIGLGAVTVSATGFDSYARVLASPVIAQNNEGTLVGGKVGEIKLTVSGTSAEGQVRLNNVTGIMGVAETSTLTAANTGSVGNITATTTGFNAYGVVNVNAHNGVNIGNVTSTATGAGAYNEVYANTDSGNIGTVKVTNSGIGSGADYGFSALDRGAVGGNIGAVTLSTQGSGSDLEGEITAEKSLTSLTATVDGRDAYFQADVSIGDNSETSLNAGTMGATVLNVKGDGADGEIFVDAYTGSDIGSVTINVAAANDAYAEYSASLYGTDTDLATLGDVKITVANTAGNQARLEFDVNKGTVGNITGTLTGGVNGSLYVDGRQASATADDEGGTVGNISLSNSSERGYTDLYVNAQKSVGNVAVNSTGAQSSFYANIVTEATGDITAVVSTDVTGTFDSVSGLPINKFVAGQIELSATDAVGTIKATGGSVDNVEIRLGYDNAVTADSIAKVDFSGFLGSSYINLSGVTAGTEILGAKGGNTIIGTDGADTIVGGDGVDVMTGGFGNDTFKFAKVVAAMKVDTVSDFTSGDKLSFSKAGLTGTPTTAYVVGALDATNFTDTGAATVAKAQFVFDADTGVLSYDADGTGSGAAVQIATLTGVTSLAASDILIAA